MINFEWENSKLKRGREKIRIYGGLVFQWTVLFAAAIVILAGLPPARAVDFWSKNQVLFSAFSAFVGSALLVMLGQSVFSWAGHSGDNVSDSTHDAGHSFPTSSISLEAARGGAGDYLADAALIQEARDFQKMCFRNAGDWGETCAKINPIFKMALARETVCLAVRAGVCEDAALLALMKQWEN